MAQQENDTQVLIIGAGPTGLLLACQLIVHNIPFRIIDKTADHTTQSRAIVIHARSMEMFDQLGIADEIVRQGKQTIGVGMIFNGKKIIKMAMKEIGTGLTNFPFFLMLEQSKTEAILSKFIETKGFKVERNSELISFTQNTNGVVATVRNAEGISTTINSRYMVGADGARSVVREQLHFVFGGKTYQQSLFVMDCKVHPELPRDEMYIAFTKEGIGGFFPLTNGRYRVLGTLPKEFDEKETLTYDDIEKAFPEWTHMDIKLTDPEWISKYRSHHRYASSFRNGNCFLAGDAAHIHSPIGGQGMNTGLQDAYNLAWKLALVLKGKAKDNLLDTYTDERVVIAKNLVQSTDRVFNFVTNKNPLIRFARQYLFPPFARIAFAAIEKLKFIRRFAFRSISEIGIAYRNSSLSQNASRGNFPRHAPKPGDRWPYISYTDADGKEVNIQDKLKGTSFHLFLFSKNNSFDELRRLEEKYKDLLSLEIITYTEQTKTLFEKFGINQSGYYLVRPDMYVAYRSDEPNVSHLEEYLSRFLRN
ncbi:MAG TPA: FAD-dependent monooxygenase [Flavipsychrobacter sp.]|nr:FAD-dependent monooxygenase [Flavipsychrobacter sp.]